MLCFCINLMGAESLLETRLRVVERLDCVVVVVVVVSVDEVLLPVVGVDLIFASSFIAKFISFSIAS